MMQRGAVSIHLAEFRPLVEKLLEASLVPILGSIVKLPSLGRGHSAVV